MEYLVIRRRAGATAAGMHTPVAAGSAQYEAISQDLPPSESDGLHRDENVLDYARSMPLTLIQPVDSPQPSSGPAAPALVGTNSWGIHAVGADSSPFSGSGVCIAVLDTGLAKSHPAFSHLANTLIGQNFTPKSAADATVDPDDWSDHDGHGTHCAGTIFGGDVAGTRIGVARGVRKALVAKVLGPGGGSTGTLLSAVNWAVKSGAQILSMSLGFDFVGLRDRLVADGVHERQATSAAMTVLVDNVRLFDSLGDLLRSSAAFGRSAVIVAACGNESDRSGRRFGGKAFTLDTTLPAAAEGFLSVGAVGQAEDNAGELRVADFSNTRATFLAPGVNVLSANAGSSPGVLRSLSGTSMATPHVAGVAALWAEKLMLNGKGTTKQICAKLQEKAIFPTGLDRADSGAGIPQAPQP